jgi:hypothetical protein
VKCRIGWHKWVAIAESIHPRIFGTLYRCDRCGKERIEEQRIVDLW